MLKAIKDLARVPRDSDTSRDAKARKTAAVPSAPTGVDHISKLPAELLLHTMAYLPLGSIAKLSLTSRRFAQLASESRLLDGLRPGLTLGQVREQARVMHNIARQRFEKAAYPLGKDAVAGVWIGRNYATPLVPTGYAESIVRVSDDVSVAQVSARARTYEARVSDDGLIALPLLGAPTLTRFEHEAGSPAVKRKFFNRGSMTALRQAHLVGTHLPMGAAEHVAISRDGQFVVSEAAGTLRLWNSSNISAAIDSFRSEEHVQDVAVSPDGRMVATASYALGARIWRRQDASSPYTFPEVAYAQRIDFSPNGKFVVACAGDNINLFDVSIGRPRSIELPESARPDDLVAQFGPPAAHSFMIFVHAAAAPTFSRDGRYFVWAEPKRVGILDLFDAQHAPRFVSFSDASHLDFSPFTHQLLLSNAQQVRIYSPDNGFQGPPTVMQTRSPLKAAHFSEDGTKILGTKTRQRNEEHIVVWNFAPKRR